MKNHRFAFASLFAGGLVVLLSQVGHAGVPLNNLQGVGGVAFNPLAYPAGQPLTADASDRLKLGDIVSKPQLGGWYVNLGDVDIDWTTIGTAFTIGKHLELSYGYEVVGISGLDNVHKNNLGAKLLLVPENVADTKFVPAVSVGAIWKNTDFDVPAGVDDSGYDLYVVATKLITQLPRPVLVSAGALSTDERVTGVLGHDQDRDIVGFANIDVLPVEFLALGFEYRQGSHYDDFRNADYWDAHVAWFVNPNLTLVAAYVDTGDEDSTSEVGLGDGLVLSAQYAF